MAAQSAALSAAADEILATPAVEQRRFVPLSSAESVLRYWSDFIPSWAGAISIDLLPVVLVLVLMIVNDAMRQESQSLEAAENITAAEMLRAMALFRQMEAAGIDVASGQPRPLGVPEAEPVAEPLVEPATAPEATVPTAPEAAVPASEAVVTPIDAAQRKRTDGPRPA